MYKRDPILNGWTLEVDKESKKYKEIKVMLMEFEKEYQHQQKRSSIFKIKFSIPHIHLKFNLDPFCTLE